ncbi:hypothetical protein [Paludisphaera sp.]|uniref:hypothetical protein n=1 Tax=Paludisphaera sp. TaxID=2017432 RepID=UPI00301D820B
MSRLVSSHAASARKIAWALAVWLPLAGLSRNPGASALAQPPGPAPVDDTPIRIETSPRVDERLFLIRALEGLYSEWPVPSGDPAVFRTQVAMLRRSAALHAAHVEARNLDPSIAKLFRDCADLLNDYDEALAGVARAEREAIDEVKQRRSRDVAHAKASGGEGSAMGDARKDPPGARATGAGSSPVVQILNSFTRAAALDETKRALSEPIATAYAARASETLAHARAATGMLAREHGWEPAEVGFDTSPEETQELAAAIERGDFRRYARILEVISHRRPRDPLLLGLLARTTAASLGPSARPEALMRQSDACLDAASLVPEGLFYDGYRAAFVADAARLAGAAAVAEIGDKGWISAPVPSAPRAVRLWRTHLAYDELDASGADRAELAWALAMAGRRQEALAEAFQVATLRRDDLTYLYALACLLSLEGRIDESFALLRHAIESCGFYNIASLKSDPDLAAVRSKKAAEFADLARVKHDWKIERGIFSDDICLTNKSAFPITNVKFKVTVASEGYSTWSRTFEAVAIFPGETHRWNTRITSRGKAAESKGVLTVDQD